MKTIVKDENLIDSHRIRDYDHQIGVFNDNFSFEDIRANELGCRFNGIYHLIDFLEKTKQFGNRRARKDDSSYQERDSDSWTQFSTYVDAVEAMRYSPETFRKFSESDIRFYNDDTVGNRIDFDKQGDYLDIGKYLEGEPDCFGNMHGGKFERKFASIVVNIAARCDVKQEEIAAKSAGVLRLIDFLESNGVRCELGLIVSTDQVHCEIIAKNYRDPLDINELAVGLSGDFFRWCIFRLTEHSAKKSGSYGCPNALNASNWWDEDADNTFFIQSLRGESKENIQKCFEKLEKRIVEDGLEDGKNYVVDWY